MQLQARVLPVSLSPSVWHSVKQYHFKGMFDQSKVVLIGCLAASACLLDNFLPSLAEEPSVYSHVYDAPQPVRFPVRFHIPLKTENF